MRSYKEVILVKIFALGRWLFSQISQIPILGYLTSCGVEEHKNALKEFAISFGFSTAAFWLSALVLMALKINEKSSYISVLNSTIQSGELFIFTVGFVGSILWTALEDPKSAKPFPGRTWHIVALFIIGFVAAAFFALAKIAYTPDIGSYFSMPFLIKASIYLALTVTVLRYLAIVYRKQTLNPEKEMKTQEQGFAKAFAEHHAVEGANV